MNCMEIRARPVLYCSEILYLTGNVYCIGIWYCTGNLYCIGTVYYIENVYCIETVYCIENVYWTETASWTVHGSNMTTTVLLPWALVPQVRVGRAGIGFGRFHPSLTELTVYHDITTLYSFGYLTCWREWRMDTVLTEISVMIDLIWETRVRHGWLPGDSWIGNEIVHCDLFLNVLSVIWKKLFTCFVLSVIGNKLFTCFVLSDLCVKELHKLFCSLHCILQCILNYITCKLYGLTER